MKKLLLLLFLSISIPAMDRTLLSCRILGSPLTDYDQKSLKDVRNANALTKYQMVAISYNCRWIYGIVDDENSLNRQSAVDILVSLKNGGLIITKPLSSIKTLSTVRAQK